MPRLRSVSFLALALTLVGAGGLAAQRTVAAEPAAAAEPAVVGVLGASVSAGFVDPKPRADGERNRTAPLRAVLAGCWPDDSAAIRDRSDLATFLDPIGRQRPKVERLAGELPALLVGVDFLFWFGYGHVGRGEERPARLAEQRQGLELLERFACPIVVGDYPDMTGADQRMLSPRQIPSPEVLAALNQELQTWAAERPNVHVFPLATWVARIKADGIEVTYDGATVHLTPERLLQGDRLHATRLGMAVLGAQLAEFLRSVLPEGDPLRPAAADFARFVAAAGAADDLREAVEAAKPEPAGERR